jgi:hypothetical protein
MQKVVRQINQDIEKLKYAPSNNIQQAASSFQHSHSEDQILLNGVHPLSARGKWSEQYQHLTLMLLPEKEEIK